MKIKKIIFLGLTLVVLNYCLPLSAVCKNKWTGVDESVVEKYAKEHGREKQKSFIDTDQGDLLLFVFLLAGVLGGFTAGYPRQNGLAIALRELGRIERSLFILDWLQSVELRRRVHAGLNKGEARNALARAVFFNRLGEIRDRSFEQQR